ncbi:hypothetical protein JZK55_06520 [Dissulfurispira thermophila]|uniref:Uncharacterized protein n=2 Tax=root TaxID=1 RepID=A0A7G1GZ16_9BACT|nr:hypothetical protein [Dissulfurispira thermophila]BCB95730.1 hypothetical protein JZK55_06520 [Dissulfurispira thermophila]
MRSAKKNKFLSLMDEVISSGMLDEILQYSSFDMPQEISNIGHEKNCKKNSIDRVFVDLYKEIIGTIRDKPPCIECCDFTIDNCAKTSRECIKFKRYVCISKAL